MVPCWLCYVFHVDIFFPDGWRPCRPIAGPCPRRPGVRPRSPIFTGVRKPWPNCKTQCGSVTGSGCRFPTWCPATETWREPGGNSWRKPKKQLTCDRCWWLRASLSKSWVAYFRIRNICGWAKEKPVYILMSKGNRLTANTHPARQKVR